MSAVDLDPIDAGTLEEPGRLAEPLTHFVDLVVRHLDRGLEHESAEEQAERALVAGVDADLGR